MADNEKFLKKLFDLANAEGEKSVAKLHVEPMVVRDGKKSYFVGDGVCGFAGVVVRPGNCALAKWGVKNKLARKHYYGGVHFPVHQYNQSYQKKVEHAAGMAKVFSLAGYNASVDSRLD